MAKHRYDWDEKKIQKYLKEGRGKGELSDYKPWLTIHDVSSKGRDTQGVGWKTNRIHQFLSDMEKNYCFYLEWADDVVDIREQFPISRDETLRIAEKKGIKHSIDQKSKTPLMMTTDFLVTIEQNGMRSEIARTVKPSSELEKPRVIEKFEIERTFWQEHGVSWGIVTEKELSKAFAFNMAWIHSAYWLNDFHVLKNIDVPLAIQMLKNQLNGTDEPVQLILDKCDREIGNGSRISLLLFRHLIAKKEVRINMEERFDVMKSAAEVIIKIKDENKRNRRIG